MVGRFVEEQDVRVGRQNAGKRRPPALAAGEAPGILGAAEVELFHEQPRPMRIVARAKARRDEGFRGGEARKVRLLREVAHRGAGLQEARARIRLDQACRNSQQRRLAGAVAADQRQPLAGADGKLRARQQRRAAEGQVNVLEKEERCGHG